MDVKPRCRRMGSLAVAAQGLLTAVAPSLSARLTKRMIAKSFDGTDELVARPSYLAQVRAIGIGMVAAGVAGYLLESDVQSDDEDDDPVGS
ncbi:hypothetical protein, partial [Halalkalirubrum salinum]|uniref:hypothetical protein n=1 Tax=Halalkalirubrum salinum TaxID=2563889 RepID=UPI0010FB2B77